MEMYKKLHAYKYEITKMICVSVDSKYVFMFNLQFDSSVVERWSAICELVENLVRQYPYFEP